MEVAGGFWYSLWQFLCFLPYFIGLLLLGTIKGIIFCPLITVIMAVGNTAVILGLWPVHLFKTYSYILSAKSLGPILKFVVCPFIFLALVIWLVVGIAASIIGGVLYGFLSPLFATFDAVGGGKTNAFFHCIMDGTWSSVTGCFNVVRDFHDVCYHSYFSYMDELQIKWSTDAKRYEIRVLSLPAALIAAVLGVLIDVPVISVVAICKSPYMLLKGWHRLLHDLIGREGPFLETICVPFAGLAILLWPLAVVGAVLGSIVASFFMGAYAAVIAYTESSLWMGICYIFSSLAIYDEYSNDVLDIYIPKGSCFPRPYYGKMDTSYVSQSVEPSLRGNTNQQPPVQTISASNVMSEFTLLETFLREFQRVGETLVSEGLITIKDVEDANSGQAENGIIDVGLPAYCILRALLRSVKSNSPGILLSDNTTEITSTNRPKDTFYDMFLIPLLIIKEQIKAENLTDVEEDYLIKLVLSNGNSDRLKEMFTGTPPESEVKKAELEALSRRLRGMTRSMSRYPTYRRRYESLKKTIVEELAKKNGMRKLPSRSSKSFIRVLSNKSFKRKTSINSDTEMSSNGRRAERDIEIQ
ncbi:hypothetical protein V2J09_002585 [Rumex salicifolius]